MLSAMLLSPDQIRQVQTAAEEILERCGWRIQDDRTLGLCRKAGCRVDEATGVVRYPRPLLRELIAQAPSSYRIAGLNGFERTIGAGRQGAMAVTNDPWVIDYPSGKPRRPRLEDVRRNTIVAQCLDRVDGLSCMDFPACDVDRPDASWAALEAHLLHHAKHYFVYATSVESLRRWLEIGRILTGGKPLADSRLFTVAVATLTPLAISAPNVELLRIACEHDLPVVPTVCPTAGMTSPNTLAGTLALGHAEVLALLALVQIHRPGHPFLYAFGPAVGNMHSGANLYYTFDKVPWKLATVQLARDCGLPVAAEVGGTMSHRLDLQSGAEGMLFALAAAGMDADLLAGYGSVYNALGHSTEAMVIQDAYVDVARRLTRGIDTDPAHLAVDDIIRAGPGGQYLMDELTLEHLRSDEFIRGELFDLSGESMHSTSLLERAHERVLAMVEGFRSPVPDDVQDRLREHFAEPVPPSRQP